jgi:hypothetical protein
MAKSRSKQAIKRKLSYRGLSTRGSYQQLAKRLSRNKSKSKSHRSKAMVCRPRRRSRSRSHYKSPYKYLIDTQRKLMAPFGCRQDQVYNYSTGRCARPPCPPWQTRDRLSKQCRNKRANIWHLPLDQQIQYFRERDANMKALGIANAYQGQRWPVVQPAGVPVAPLAPATLQSARFRLRSPALSQGINQSQSRAAQLVQEAIRRRQTASA